jgi:membrane protease YdiL (CAAX protease family)
LDNATLKTLLAVLSFQGAALVLAHRFVREHQVGWTDAFGLKNNRRQALALGFFVMFSALPICWILQMLSVSALQHLHIEAPEQTAVKILRGTDTMLNRIVLGIAAIGIAPVAEEILFRGILYPAIKQSGFPRLAIWITSLLFGAIHLNLVTFIPLTLLALLLVWLYEKTDNLLACITLHSLFNAANFAMIYILPWLADRFPQLAPS